MIGSFAAIFGIERTIALIDEKLPVVVLAAYDPADPSSRIRYEKTLSNIQEVKAREGIVIGIIAHVRILPDAARAAESRAPRLHLAFRRRAHHPTAPGRVRGIFTSAFPALAHAGIERGVEVAFLVEDRAVGVFVVIARNAPARGGGEVFIGHAIAIGVAHHGHAVCAAADGGGALRFINSPHLVVDNSESP